MDLENSIRALEESMYFATDALGKQITDLMIYRLLGDKADIDISRIPGLPPANTTAQSDQDKGNPIIFRCYTFVPKGMDTSVPQPMLVFVHQGIHGTFDTECAHVISELLEDGYVIVAPDYRGSSGYGEQFWKMIDYGGRETEDAFTAMQWALTKFPFVDPKRVGILGWSHGGMITLMNIFEHPGAYAAAFAGVPVSDVVARMGYKGAGYEKLFSADYHIGKTAAQDPAEYRRRSPAWNAHKYDGTPLLIYTNTADEDVNCLEVEHLIKALKAEGKTGFEYRIFENAPGGHYFDRLDTPEAQSIRRDIRAHLAKHLK